MAPLTQAALVALGGAIGSVLRFAVNGWALRHYPGFAPAGTLIVNVTGCLVIGMLMAALRDRPAHARDMQALLVTGVLGGFTTFSAFGYQTVELLEEQQLRRALLNVLANVCGGCLAAWLGIAITHRILGK